MISPKHIVTSALLLVLMGAGCGETRRIEIAVSGQQQGACGVCFNLAFQLRVYRQLGEGALCLLDDPVVGGPTVTVGGVGAPAGAELLVEVRGLCGDTCCAARGPCLKTGLSTSPACLHAKEVCGISDADVLSALEPMCQSGGDAGAAPEPTVTRSCVCSAQLSFRLGEGSSLGAQLSSSCTPAATGIPPC